ncbi:hypothetical protein [Kitasatospora griseola]|nr:hypothetical protein [Kitasatospora griseola]
MIPEQSGRWDREEIPMTASVTENALREVPLDSWNRLAEMANALADENGGATTGEQIKDDYINITEEASARSGDGFLVGLPSPQALPNGDLVVGPYEVQVPDIPAVTIVVEGTYHSGGPNDWYLKGTAKLKVAGKTVWTTEYHFSALQRYASFHPDVLLAKADVTVGVFGSNNCLRIFGQGCYRYTPMSSWTCSEFDETLLCFAQQEVMAQAAVEPFAVFQGECGANSGATSEQGLKIGQQVQVGDETDLSSCVVGNNQACVYSIRLIVNSGVYGYAIQVDGQGPRTLVGSFYLAFKDDTGAIYKLNLTSSTRSTHTVKFNTAKPIFHSFKWSNGPIPKW